MKWASATPGPCCPGEEGEPQRRGPNTAAPTGRVTAAAWTPTRLLLSPAPSSRTAGVTGCCRGNVCLCPLPPRSPGPGRGHHCRLLRDSFLGGVPSGSPWTKGHPTHFHPRSLSHRSHAPNLRGSAEGMASDGHTDAQWGRARAGASHGAARVHTPRQGDGSVGRECR